MPTKNLSPAKVPIKSSSNSLLNSSPSPSANNSSSPNYLIDSHCHLHDREFFTTEQAREMLARAYKNHVTKIICIGTSINDSLAAQKFANETNNQSSNNSQDINNFQNTNNPQDITDPQEPQKSTASSLPTIYWTFGIHPENAKDLNTVKELADSSQPVLQTAPTLPIAIGEVGLDYHYPGYDRAAQIKLFEVMLQLALDHHLPLSLHIREAFDDFLAIIKNFPNTRAVVHSFSDNKKHLRAVLETTDFYIGVNGMATYSTLPTPPLDRILLETDAPFLTPKPFRGIINEPGYVSAVAKWLAEHLGQDLITVQEETTKNATRLFGL